jgi:hypothetical protein
VVNASLGPGQVIAIVNGGDSEIVGRNLEDLAAAIFRADSAVELMVHEERARRGQFLGLLDALRQWRREGRTFDSDGVALGIMLPGKGTRLSPITQRLHGIKPFMPMLVRQGRDGCWLNTAAASLYTWTLLAHHLQRMGFRGIAWKWGDEPQITAHRLAEMNLDLSRANAVRFSVEVEVTEDLAVNKEWLLRHPTSGELTVQVRRRSRAELLQRFEIVDRGQPVKALVHIGSPAFSYPFLEEAEALFGDFNGWIDVDGYLFEALTHDADAWQTELDRDAGLQQLVAERPDFWQRVQQLKRRLGERRGTRWSSRSSTSVIYLGACRIGPPTFGKTLAGVRTTPNPNPAIPTPSRLSSSRCASAKSRPTRSSEISTHVSASRSVESCLTGKHELPREATEPLNAPNRLSGTNCAPDVSAMISPRPHQPRHAIATRTRMFVPCSHGRARIL